MLRVRYAHHSPSGGSALEHRAHGVAVRWPLYASLVPTSKAAALTLTLLTQDGDHRLSRPEDLCVP